MRTSPSLIQVSHRRFDPARTAALAVLAAALAGGLALAGCGGGPGNGVTPSGAAPAAVGRVSNDTAGPTYDGCPVFRAKDSAYNKNISGAPLDPQSTQYIASLGTNSSWNNDQVEYLNAATASTPVLPVISKVKWHSMPPEPWASSFIIENLGDAHSFVIDTSACHIYELYSTTYANGQLSAYSGGDWNLKKKFVPYPPGVNSAVASGLSRFAGSVKYPELASGNVSHALFLLVPYNMLAQWSFVRPASDTDQIPYKGPGPVEMPYGAKLRLRADYPESNLGSQALIVVHALKTYGALVGDTACCYGFVYMHDLATPDAFDFSDLNKLNAIKPADWQVIKLPQILQVPGH